MVAGSTWSIHPHLTQERSKDWRIKIKADSLCVRKTTTTLAKQHTDHDLHWCKMCTPYANGAYVCPSRHCILYLFTPLIFQRHELSQEMNVNCIQIGKNWKQQMLCMCCECFFEGYLLNVSHMRPKPCYIHRRTPQFKEVFYSEWWSSLSTSSICSWILMLDLSGHSPHQGVLTPI